MLPPRKASRVRLATNREFSLLSIRRLARNKLYRLGEWKSQIVRVLVCGEQRIGDRKNCWISREFNTVTITFPKQNVVTGWKDVRYLYIDSRWWYIWHTCIVRSKDKSHMAPFIYRVLKTWSKLHSGWNWCQLWKPSSPFYDPRCLQKLSVTCWRIYTSAVEQW